MIEALKAFPAVAQDRRLDPKRPAVLYKHYYNIVAVSTKRGLMVPVVQDADARLCR